jgi:hypothetical protein
MESAELDRLKSHYQQVLRMWVTTIQREEELLASTTHSARSEDLRERADFDQEEAQSATQKAKREYEDAVRQANFGF